MSEYLYESGMSTQRRKQRRTAITILLTLLLIFGAFWWAWAYIRGDEEPVAGDETTAPAGPAATDCVDAKAVTFNVYNSTGRAGLARTAADALTAAGFTVGAVANDPENKDLPGNVEIRFGPEGEPFATSFRDDYGQDVSPTKDDARTGTAVDVVLGDTFSGWAAFPEAGPCPGSDPAPTTEPAAEATDSGD